MWYLDRLPHLGPLWRKAWLAVSERRCVQFEGLACWASRVAKVALGLLADAAEGVKAETMEDTQILLCTVASTVRLLREWEETVGSPLFTHTVIVDECGCTPESSTAMLLRLKPRNLVLIGDHRQLPPCSLVPPADLRGTGHDRSLLERCVLASGKVHRLCEQYRMHDSICKSVSSLFYENSLRTPPEVARSRAAAEGCPLSWVQVRGPETKPPGERSLVNPNEVSAAEVPRFEAGAAAPPAGVEATL